MANELAPFIAPKPAALVDARGRPLRKSDLTREIAGPSLTGVRSIHSGHPAQGLTPERLAQILRAAENGNATAYLELAEEMEEKDLHYLSVLGTRKRAVSQLPIEVDAASDSAEDEADAQIVRDWLERDTLQSELFDILDGVGKGYSATEIIWDIGELWLPAKLKRQDPRFFEFDRVDGETLLLKGDSGLPTPLQDYKFIVHHHPAKSGIPIRGGIARAVAWGYLFKNYTLKDWMTFLEVYGLPLRIGKYDNGETEQNIRLLEQAVAQIGADAGAVIPKSMMIEFITSSGSGTGSTDMYERKANFIDQQVSKAVLGQTSTTDALAGGLGSGQATTHNDVRADIETADCVQLSATLNRDLVRPMVIFNRGPRKKYPRLRIGRPDPVDVDKALASIQAGVQLGVPVAVSTFRKLTGLPEPEAGEELLQAPQPEIAPENDPEAPDGPDPREKGKGGLLEPLKGQKRPDKRPVAAALSDRPSGPDGIDRAIDEHLDDWERLIEPMLSPVQTLIEGASSLEQVRDGLAAAIAAMDTSAVAELIERAGFGARMAGNLENPEG
jgi:phage gp29-like protein